MDTIIRKINQITITQKQLVIGAAATDTNQHDEEDECTETASVSSSTISKSGKDDGITVVAAGIRRHPSQASMLFEQQLFQEEEEEEQRLANAKEDSIVLNFVSNEGKWIALRVKKTQTFADLKKKYVDKLKLNVGIDSVRFLLDGERLDNTKTPADYEMENKDQIDVFLEQFGGGGTLRKIFLL